MNPDADGPAEGICFFAPTTALADGLDANICGRVPRTFPRTAACESVLRTISDGLGGTEKEDKDEDEDEDEDADQVEGAGALVTAVADT